MSVELARDLLLPIAATEAAGLTLSAALHGHSSRSLGSVVWWMESIGVYLQGIMRGESKGPRYNFL